MDNTRASLLNKSDGKCVNIALDLGVFGDLSFSKGIEDLKKSLPKIISGSPDVIQLNVGGLKLLRTISNFEKVVVALRLDVTNVYEPRNVSLAWDVAGSDEFEDLLYPQVAAVVLNLLNVDGDSVLHQQCISNIQKIGAKARKLGVPLMVEPLVMTAQPKGGNKSSGDYKMIAALVRQAVELGADFIKVDPTIPMNDFEQVVKYASEIPVFVRGGGQVTPQELLERTKIAMDVGASGVVYGRNVVQHENPALMINAIKSIVHSGFTVSAATQMLLSKG